jgi:hypothetical protein
MTESFLNAEGSQQLAAQTPACRIKEAVRLEAIGFEPVLIRLALSCLAVARGDAMHPLPP